MSLVDHDSWDIEHEGCERLRRKILGQLNDRRQLLVNSREYVQLTDSIQIGIEQLRKDLKHLRVMLDNAITWETSPQHELQQRRINWDKLESQLREIDAIFTSSTRANQLAQTTTSGSFWQAAGSNDAPAPPHPPPPHDVVSLQQRQAEILDHQNRGLEALSATISRQRSLATQLGQEVEDQNDLLDNLSNTMGRVELGVQQETRNISQVNRRDSTWCYWLLIISLFVAIIVVIFV
ncbi:probable syntaxin-8B [Drosophila grimshawi]|uniref:GH15579 n=1 Tax=Drosophila grimshawi TaxID=7222 RepID=B4J0X1_DROGR|nr:probable syntaxin-8B [Drosophila grimshawi]EDV95792.1 GH15579 [Drosophila grimshawi]